MTRCERGSEPIRRLLRTKLHDVRDESVETFPRWLERHLRGWVADPVYQQRLRIREIRRSRPDLQALEQEREFARADFEASPEYQQHEKLRRELAGAENAVAGLAHAHAREKEDGARARLFEKLAIYERTAADLGAEMELLRAASHPWQRLHDVATRLSVARAGSGFDREILRLTELQRSHGRSGGRSGSAFESLAADAVREHVLPEFGGEYGRPGPMVLNRVRLGSSRAEFDQLVIHTPSDQSAPVTVLAAIEAKRNPNDLAHGFRNRIENLAWFAGRAGLYNSEDYRTGAFPDGHFDRPAVHQEQGRRYLFTRASFAAFDLSLFRQNAPGGLPEGVYLVTRPSSLWGIGSGAIARLAHRVSSDLAFDLGDPGYMSALLEWTRSLAREVEAPELLRGVTRDEPAARRILLLSAD